MHGSRPSADSAWRDFLLSGVQYDGFDPVDGGGRAGRVVAGSGGDPAAIRRLLPLRAAAGAARRWPVEGRAGCAWRAAGAGAVAVSSVQRAEEPQ